MSRVLALVFGTALLCGPAFSSSQGEPYGPLDEAMTICTTPSNNLDQRHTALLEKGWRGEFDAEAFQHAYADALLVANQPEQASAQLWSERRMLTKMLAKGAGRDAITLTKSGTFAQLSREDQNSFAVCLLGSLNDASAAKIFTRLLAADGAQEGDFGRFGEMYAIRQDATGANWRTNIRLHELFEGKLDDFLEEPLVIDVVVILTTYPMGAEQ